MRRAAIVTVSVLILSALAAGPALACGGLVSPNGTIALVRTTTLAAYHNGIEHYVTGFKFVGGSSAAFGSIIPLPGVPSRVIRGGDWTLQRLELEVSPPVREAAFALSSAGAAGDVKVILQKKIDALDVTILKGGGFAVGKWVKDHGFALTPDAPKMLDFYARRSPVFMAVKFDPKRAKARGESVGDAIPVHLVIPTKRPWVPLRILALGSKGAQPVSADVFLLNDRAPAMLPAPVGSGELLPSAPGLRLVRSEAASSQLLSDLRSDQGMNWVPRSGMWLSFLKLDVKAKDLTYDLAINPSGGMPSAVDAGLVAPHAAQSPTPSAWPLWVGLGILVALLGLGLAGQRSARPAV